MATSQNSKNGISNPVQLTFLSEELPAKHSASQDSAKDSTIQEETLHSHFLHWLTTYDLNTSSGKMSPEFCPQVKDEISLPSSGALAELGYGFAWRVCDAQYFGVPQRRKRVFLLAIEGAGNWRTAAEILFERKSLCGDIAESDEAGEGTTSDAGASVETGGRNIIGTLDTECGFGKQTHQSIVNGHLIPFRKSKRATSTTDNETWVEADSSNTLNNFDLGDTRTTHAVVQPIPIQDGREIEKKQNGMGVANEGDHAYTIDTTGSQSVAIQFEPKIIKTSELRLSGKITEQETCPTLTAGAKGGDSEPLAITFQPGNLRRDAGADPSTQATTTLKATPGDQMPTYCLFYS